MRTGTKWLALLGVLTVVWLSACAELSVQPGSGPQGAVEMEVMLHGTQTQWNSSTQASFPLGSSIQINEFEVKSKTRARMVLSIPADEEVGSKKLKLTTGSDVVSARFEVTPQPTVASKPTSVEQGATEVQLSLKGTDTRFSPGTFHVSSAYSWLEVVSWKVIDFTHAEITVNVSAGAIVGSYAEVLVLETDFQQVPCALDVVVPTVRSVEVTPASAGQNHSVTIEIAGEKTHFNGSTEVGFNSEAMIYVNEVRIISETRIEADISVDAHCAIGVYSLRVKDNLGALYTAFEVTYDPPDIFFTPDGGGLGDVITVDATGVNTHFESGTTYVEVSPAGRGLSMQLDSIADQTHASLTATIQSHAEPQTYEVTLVTYGERAKGNFIVRSQPYQPSVLIDPTSGRQAESVDIEITGQFTNFDATTRVEFPGTNGVTVDWLSVQSSTEAHAQLTVDKDADIGAADFVVITDSQTEEATAVFTVLAGVPSAELNPSEASQGATDLLIDVQGQFTDFNETTAVTAEGGCGVTIHDVTVVDSETMSFRVDVGLLESVGSCPIRINTTTPQQEVMTVLEVVEGYSEVSVGTQVDGFVDGPTFFSVNLVQGDVVSIRAERLATPGLDPVVSLIGTNGDITSPLAENDDECEAGVDSLIVYRAPVSGEYFIRVKDRLGFNTGPFSLTVNPYAPEDVVENEPNDSLPGGYLFGRLARGTFSTGDSTDIYHPYGTMDSTRVAVQVLAWEVSPYETSGAKARMTIYDPAQIALYETSDGTELFDPVIYVDAADLGYIELVATGGEETLYWLNTRPHIVINELLHDEVNGWMGGYVELFGEPGYPLDGCHLKGKVFEAGVPSVVFDIDLGAHALSPSGYFTLAHDSLVPGSGPSNIDSDLVVDDSSSTYTTIGIVLECGGSKVDAVCYRGNELAECEGNPMPDVAGSAMGRGFHIDTNRNEVDFMEQIEPSPWARNLTEVAR